MKKLLFGATAFALLATPALAHHPLAGQPMETFTHGVLSGVGHPLLGFDHLLFVVIVGIAALFTGYARSAPFAYIAAMVVGCLMMSFGTGLPLKEFLIGLSLLVVGGYVLSGKAMSMTTAMVLFAGFGLFHGSAFGDSVAAQEAAVGGGVLIGYLLGLGVVQYLIAIAAGRFAETVLNATEASVVNARLAGAVIAGVGLFLTLENIEGFAFAAAGIAG